MDTGVIIAIVVAALVVGALALWLMSQKKKDEDLKRDFGPEYEREIARTGSKTEAQKELDERKKRVKSYNIVELSPDDQRRFADEWRTVEAHFVDDPGSAVSQADEFVARLMFARGYPVTDPEQQAADISVDHPDVVTNYRSAHLIVEEHLGGRASTEALRQAMMHYRAVADELLGNTTALGARKAS